MRTTSIHRASGAMVAMALALSSALTTNPAAASTGAARDGVKRVGSIIEVFPGRHAIKKALAIAQAGDVLNIHAGTYKEHVTVSTPDITLQSNNDEKVVVDARCNANYAIFVTADGVTIHGLTVQGAAEGFGDFPSEIGLQGVHGTGLIELTEVRNTCDAEYGIQVFDSGSIRIENNFAHGFSDSGIYLGAITSTPDGPMVAVKNVVQDSHQGIIVEDSAGGDIEVLGNAVDGNLDAGIFLHNSDGVLIRDNLVHDNGRAGIDLDPTSDDNRVARNTSLGNTYDLENEGGTGNCFRHNTYETKLGRIKC